MFHIMEQYCSSAQSDEPAVLKCLESMTAQTTIVMAVLYTVCDGPVLANTSRDPAGSCRARHDVIRCLAILNESLVGPLCRFPGKREDIRHCHELKPLAHGMSCGVVSWCRRG